MGANETKTPSKGDIESYVIDVYNENGIYSIQFAVNYGKQPDWIAMGEVIKREIELECITESGQRDGYVGDLSEETINKFKKYCSDNSIRVKYH